MKTRTVAAALLVGLLELAACVQPHVPPASEGNPSASTTVTSTDRDSTAPSTSTTTRQSEPGTTITAANSDFGTILFDTTGQAIYIFEVETTTKPLCYGACAEAWPPVLTQAAPLAGPGVQGSLLGTTSRAEGTTQVTYGGRPLYFYAHEGKHEVKCHDVFLNGGRWYAVQPDGSRAP